MNAIQNLAVAKVVKDKAIKEASKATSPGEYEVDLTVRIHGKIKKGADFQKTMPHTVKWSMLAALLASKVNDETLDAVLRELAEATDSGENDRLEAQIKETAQLKIDEIKGQTTKTVGGPVTTQLAVEIAGPYVSGKIS